MSLIFCSPAAEESFVGCAIASEGNAVSEFPVALDHFHTTGPRIIMAAVLALHAAGSPISGHTVSERITADQARDMGGDHRVSELCFFPASVRETGHFFAILEEKLTLRRSSELAKWIEREIPLSGDGVSEFTAELHRRAGSIESVGDGENVFQPCLQAVRAELDRMDAGTVESGLLTRLSVWNSAFGGVMDGQLYGIAGRPGTGKTSMMEMLIADFLTKGLPVCVFEKDMSPTKLIARIACRVSRIPYFAYAKGFMSRDQTQRVRNNLDLLQEAPLNLYNPANLTAERMCGIARRDIRTKGVKCVFLDHVQALRVGRDLREGLTRASLTIRANVTDTGVSHIVLAHINRDGAKGGRPKPEHIKEFDQLYGDADGMVMLWSEIDPADNTEDKLRVKFYVAKNRDGGVSEEELLFDGRYLTFENKPV